jgi:hypothetical protein
LKTVFFSFRRTARDYAEFKRKKSQQSAPMTPPKILFNFANRLLNSPTTPTNDHNQEDEDTQMRSIEATLVTHGNEPSNSNIKPTDSHSSRRSSRSTTNTDDDQYELVRQLTANNNQTSTDVKPTSSPEMLSSATSLSSPSSSSSDDDEPQDKANKNATKPVIHESGRFEPEEMTAEQANLLAEASTTA